MSYHANHNLKTYQMDTEEYVPSGYQPNTELRAGDTVVFLRQAVGYPTKKLIGVIVDFNYVTDFANKIYPCAHIKSDCEYGGALPYNHTIDLKGLTKV